MMLRRGMLQKLQRNWAQCAYLAYSSQVPEASVEDVGTSYLHRLPDRKPMMPQKKPFVKTLLTGTFDVDMLAYPQPHDFERNKSFFEWLEPIEDYIVTINARHLDELQDIPQEVMDKLRELGVWGAKVNENYGGMNLIESEMVKLIETLSRVPCIGLYMTKHSKCVDIITEYASEEVKQQLLPGIAKGTLIPTMCITEASSEDKKVIKMQALAARDNRSWILHGQKLFVPYAHKANLFLTLCNCSHTGDPFKTEQMLSLLYAIEPKGLSLEYVETLGMRGLKHFNVKFTDVAIPKDCIIGEIGTAKAVYRDYMTKHRYYTGAMAVGMGRHFCDILAKYAINKVHLDKPLYEHDAAKDVLGRMTHSVYTIESMTYLTSSLADLYEKQDISVEAGLVESFAATECVTRFLRGMYLLGAPAYLRSNEYELVLRDAQALTMFELSVIDSEILSTLLALVHVGSSAGEDVVKARNPFQHPTFGLLDLFSFRKLSVKTSYYLHPSLQDSSVILESVVLTLVKATREIIVKHGAKVTEGHMDLLRLYRMMSLVYSLVSVISRASRSYCDGWRNALEDLHMADAQAYMVRQEVNTLYQQITDGDWINGDKAFKDVTKITLSEKRYFPEHPLTYNYA